MHDAVVTNTSIYTSNLYVRRFNKPVSKSISLLGLPTAPGVAARTAGENEINSSLKRNLIVVVEVRGITVAFGNVTHHDTNICNQNPLRLVHHFRNPSSEVLTLLRSKMFPILLEFDHLHRRFVYLQNLVASFRHFNTPAMCIYFID